MKRQTGSLLFERTGLSIDKKGLLQTVNKKTVPARKEDIIRDPYIFEFLGLDETGSLYFFPLTFTANHCFKSYLDAGIIR